VPFLEDFFRSYFLRKPLLSKIEGRVARWYIFKPKIPIWVNLEDLEMENVDVYYGHWEFITAIWYILWPFGIFYGHLVYFMAI
jgi:hypothetical protein